MTSPPTCKRRRFGRLLPTLLVACLAGAPFGGCSVILRALDIRIGNVPLEPGEAPLDPGRYSGSSQCTTLVVVEGEPPVGASAPLAIEANVGEDLRLSRNGVAVDTGRVAGLPVWPYILLLTNTATESSRRTFAAQHTVEVTIDAGTTAEVTLFGEATETFTQSDDGGVLYALATEMHEQGVGGERGPRTLAVQCEFALARQ